MGVGQARNRVPAAVQRTVPFGMLMMSLVYCWYTRYGHHPDDVTARRTAAPWYTTKTEPSFEDMLAKLRRTIIAARFLPEPKVSPLHSKSPPCTGPGPQQPRSAKVEFLSQEPPILRVCDCGTGIVSTRPRRSARR
jgi:hypothetical protein